MAVSRFDCRFDLRSALQRFRFNGRNRWQGGDKWKMHSRLPGSIGEAGVDHSFDGDLSGMFAARPRFRDRLVVDQDGGGFRMNLLGIFTMKVDFWK